MPFHYSVESVTFSGGSRVELPRVGVTLIVGPNNVGKSRCLREVAIGIGAVHAGGVRPIVTTKITDRREGTAAELDAWLGAKYPFTEVAGGGSFSGLGFSTSFSGVPRETWLEGAWPNNESPYRFAFGRAFASHLDTETRLRAANSVAAHDALEGRGSHALHALYESQSLEDSLSAVFRRAFGQDLVVDRMGGSKVALRVGVRPRRGDTDERFSIPYARSVRELTLLDEQGDGVRSYVACILHTDVFERPVVIVDEPDTFLHPPQARGLARHLASTAKTKGLQIIVATHSSDIVRGALDDSDVDVSVIRLTRDERGNHARQLDAGQVRTLWNDPLLRASNLLDALFHERLVLCEADGDCRFYNAVLEVMCDDTKMPRPNVMFSHTGGKARLHVAAAALVALGVPVTVIADIDVLSEEQPLRKIWEALGHRWSEEIEALHKRVKSAVGDTVKKPARERIRERFLELIDAMKEATLDTKALDSLRAVFRSEGGWERLKSDGVSAFPKADARTAADELMKLLARGGLHVVPVGELEGFIPTIAGHGPAWVVEALERDLAKAPETEAARAFVRELGIILAP